MKIKELGHLAFKCRDLKASVAFYRDVLGFTQKFALYFGDIVEGLRQDVGKEEEIERFMPLYNDPWIVYMQISDRVFIELFDPQGAEKVCVPDNEHCLNYQHLALIVEDIHEARNELAAKGAPIDIEPSMGMDGTWQMWSHDPDGNKIEFMQYTENSMQLIGR